MKSYEWNYVHLNDRKIQVVCWGHYDILWGLKNVYDSGIFRSLQWLYDLIHHTVQCVLCTEGRQSFSWFHSHLQLCLDFQEIKRMQDYYCWYCQCTMLVFTNFLFFKSNLETSTLRLSYQNQINFDFYFKSKYLLFK